ncbi:tartrate dehydrogenase [Penicillium paradoxum]|uniref:tartrate dehydrogenase n=1 Tax=Penicillium paradoxum TaxID=176176 RepID=UPI0025490B33|nr:tartrate dehydrogenase [Penicillium paradoxum]KAJ5788606.1 tartrate dehydrogenase [Penicillium paradoxum]
MVFVVINPQSDDIIVSKSLLVSILTDLAAVLAGSTGVEYPSATTRRFVNAFDVTGHVENAVAIA